ncbi:hypothetical protein KKC94_05135 [Patescibacteria group bacterium]|nr:hypothetical protein [Patescibacteria group bacterium]
MNIKRAIGIIFLLAIAVQITAIIGSKLLGIDLETADPENMPSLMWFVALISVTILSAVAAMWFFNSPKTLPSLKNGLLFCFYLRTDRVFY